MLNSNPNIGVRQLARDLAINKNTACSLIDRLKKAMNDAEQRSFLLKLAYMQEDDR
jgi:hypothetical protein